MLGLSFLKGDKAMSEKRRDNRNRILHEGEYQRADGRYRFRYVDIHGNEGNLYSWRLDHNDPIPKENGAFFKRKGKTAGTGYV